MKFNHHFDTVGANFEIKMYGKLTENNSIDTISLLNEKNVFLLYSMYWVLKTIIKNQKKNPNNSRQIFIGSLKYQTNLYIDVI